jgi:hypothetical protein
VVQPSLLSLASNVLEHESVVSSGTQVGYSLNNDHYPARQFCPNHAIITFLSQPSSVLLSVVPALLVMLVSQRILIRNLHGVLPFLT